MTATVFDHDRGGAPRDGLAVNRLLPIAAALCTDHGDKLVKGYSLALLAKRAGRISFKTDAIVIGLCGELGMIPFFDLPPAPSNTPRT